MTMRGEFDYFDEQTDPMAMGTVDRFLSFATETEMEGTVSRGYITSFGLHEYIPEMIDVGALERTRAGKYRVLQEGMARVLERIKADDQRLAEVRTMLEDALFYSRDLQDEKHGSPWNNKAPRRRPCE